jgi:hypothetical protein
MRASKSKGNQLLVYSGRAELTLLVRGITVEVIIEHEYDAALGEKVWKVKVWQDGEEIVDNFSTWAEALRRAMRYGEGMVPYRMPSEQRLNMSKSRLRKKR